MHSKHLSVKLDAGMIYLTDVLPDIVNLNVKNSIQFH